MLLVKAPHTVALATPLPCQGLARQRSDAVPCSAAEMSSFSPAATHVLPASLPADRGWAVSLYFGYMKGVNNNLSLTHVPEIPPRTNILAGGRRQGAASSTARN